MVAKDALLWTADETVADGTVYPKDEYVDVKKLHCAKITLISQKHLKARIYLSPRNNLTSDWVQEPQIYVISKGEVIVIAKVNGSQSA